MRVESDNKERVSLKVVIAVITVMVLYRKCDSGSVFAPIRKGWVFSSGFLLIHEPNLCERFPRFHQRGRGKGGKQRSESGVTGPEVSLQKLPLPPGLGRKLGVFL